MSSHSRPHNLPRSPYSQSLPPRSPHTWAPHAPTLTHIPRPPSRRTLLSAPPPTHRVPFGAVIPGGAFGPWWSRLSRLPGLSFLPTLPAWALEDEGQVQMVPRGS